MNMKSIYNYKYSKSKFSYLQIGMLLILLSTPSISIAQWHIVSHENLSNNEKTRVAFTENKKGADAP